MQKRLLDRILKVSMPFMVILGLATVLVIPTTAASADSPSSGPRWAFPNRNTANVEGTISAVSGNSITITPRGGSSQITLTTDANTNIDLHGLDALATGQTVAAVYNSQTMVAERVMVTALSPSPGNYAKKITVVGAIAAISGNSITITPSNGSSQVTLTVDTGTNTDLHGLDALATEQTVTAVYNSQTLVAEKCCQSAKWDTF